MWQVAKYADLMMEESRTVEWTGAQWPGYSPQTLGYDLADVSIAEAQMILASSSVFKLHNAL